MENLLRDILVELQAIRIALDVQAAPVKSEYYRQLASAPLTPETIRQHNSAIVNRQRQKAVSL